MLMDGQADALQAYDAFEDVLRRNARLSGSTEFETHLLDAKGLHKYLCDFNVIKGMLWCLVYEVDEANIAYLKSRGYHINTSGKRAYRESIELCMTKSDNLMSKIKSKIKEMERKAEKNQGFIAPSFEQIMANLCAALGFQVTDDIKLARYNEYCKVIKDRNRKKERK